MRGGCAVCGVGRRFERAQGAGQAGQGVYQAERQQEQAERLSPA